MDREFGSIVPGKYADMILVTGDPTKNIRDIRHVDTVIKGRNFYLPSEMYPAFSIRAK
jgi:imidazolonepropionase-like amidohydrolase